MAQFARDQMGDITVPSGGYRDKMNKIYSDLLEQYPELQDGMYSGGSMIKKKVKNCQSIKIK